MTGFLKALLASAALLSFAATAPAQALPAPGSSLPVQVAVEGNVATAIVGSAEAPLAEVFVTFDQPQNLSAASLGLSARLFDPLDAVLQARLPDPQLNVLQSGLPLLLTIEPPVAGGLRFRTARVEVHTHALVYSVGSSLRLFKAPLGGNFFDITDEIAPGSVRARGTTNGFSQFLVLADLRQSSDVIAAKIDALRQRIDTLPLSEQPPFRARLADVQTALANADYPAAIAATDWISDRALKRAGTWLTDAWIAGGADNQAGGLIAGAATLKFSIAYLRDFGQ